MYPIVKVIPSITHLRLIRISDTISLLIPASLMRINRILRFDPKKGLEPSSSGRFHSRCITLGIFPPWLACSVECYSPNPFDLVRGPFHIATLPFSKRVLGANHTACLCQLLDDATNRKVEVWRVWRLELGMLSLSHSWSRARNGDAMRPRLPGNLVTCTP